MSELGQWVARFKGDRRITKYHYVESEIAAREVTRCGRQLGPIEGTEITAFAVITPGDDACQRCLR